MTAPVVLVVQHEDDAPPALVGEWLAAAGLHLDVRRPFRGEPVPETLDGVDALLVLGGAMSAYDDATCPWLTPTKHLLAEAVDREVATLGICLGHQLLAVASGGSVVKNPAGKQIGVLVQGLTAAAADDALLGELSATMRCLQWNDDVVDRLPNGAVVLAQTPAGHPQVVRLGRRAWGLQAHPEVGVELVTAWVAGDAERQRQPAGVVDAALADLRAAEPELAATWRPVLERFAAVVHETAGTVVPAAH